MRRLALVALAWLVSCATEHRAAPPELADSAQGLVVSLERGAVAIRGASFDIATSCIGRASTCALPSIATVRARDQALDVQRDGVREWYRRTAQGVEQGFDVAARPPGEGELVVRLRVRGAAVRVDGDEAIAGAVRVSALQASDARGARLRAWMTAEGSELSLHVDDAGATYPIVIDPIYGAEAARLSPSTPAALESFGSTIRISGDTAIVGVPGAVAGTLANSGAAEVFVRAGATWTRQARILNPEPATNAGFGAAVAISGDTALVGAYGAPSGTKTTVGAAYVFLRTGTSWSLQQKLTPAVTNTDDWTGSSVALDGDTAVVSSSGADHAGVVDVGAHYVFVRSGTTWTEQAKLMRPDPVAYYRLGGPSAVHGDTILIGDSIAALGGAVYVFGRAGTAWSQQATLRGSGVVQYSDRFGASLALRGDVALIGAPYANITGRPDGGLAYVFARSGATWTEQAKFAPSDAVMSDEFGSSVALYGATAVIGALGVTTGTAYRAGAAYVFTNSGSLWTQQAKFIAPDAQSNMSFARSLGLDADTVVIGAPGFDSGTLENAGAAYAYRLMPTKANGASCAAATECTSGLCAESVCCDKPCTGACVSCRAEHKVSGADGACGPIRADVDPKNLCAASTGTCAADGMCDGAGSCRSFAKAGTACGTTTCVAGSVTGKVCKGDAADCIDTTASCAPYACGGSVCKASCASDAECTASSFCAKTSTCAPKLTNGSPCAEARECASAFCVDGFCCNVKCHGQCEACDDGASAGTCRAIVGAPHGARTMCAAGAAACAGRCDGINRGACSHPAGKECSARCADNEQVVGRCTASGACVEDLPALCGGYTCTAGKCRSDCATNSDCAPKYLCQAGKCEPAGTSCSEDGTAVLGGDGATFACAPYRCRDGACVARCSSAVDCINDTVCDASGACVPRPPREGVTDDGGCAHGASRETSSLLALAVLLGLARLRRR